MCRNNITSALKVMSSVKARRENIRSMISDKQYKKNDIVSGDNLQKSVLIQTVKNENNIYTVSNTEDIDFSFTEKSQYFIGKHIRHWSMYV